MGVVGSLSARWHNVAESVLPFGEAYHLDACIETVDEKLGS